MAFGAGTAWVAVKPNMAGFSGDVSRGATKGGQTAGSRFSEGFKSKLKVAGAIGAAFAVAAGGKFLKDSIKEASDLGESINAVNVTFGKNAAGIKKLGKEAANAVGLSNSEFNGLSVQFSAFAQTIAGKGGNVVATIKDLTTRGADFASVMNLDVNEAMGLFQSGLAGETEPLRKFGIDLSAAAVEAHAYTAGIAASGEELTENQKVQARYSLLMKQTAKTQGDFKNTSDDLANSQRILGANWKNLQAQVGAKLVPALEKLSGWALNTGLPALRKTASFIKDNKNVILAMAGALAVSVVALKAYKVATALATAWTNRQTIAQTLLNRAMMLNPIGLIVGALVLLVAGLVVAYKQSDTFRKIVDNAWAKVKVAVKVAWERVIKPAFSAMWTFIQKVLIPVIQWLWSKVVKPVFGFIGKAIKFWWNTIVKPVFAALKWYFTKVLFPVIRFLWNKVVKPAFKGIGATIKWTWNNVIKPAFNALRTGLGKVKDAFETAKNGIRRVWNALKAIVKAPIKAVVWLINKGLIAPFNFVSGKLGGPTIDPIKLPKGFRRGGWTGPGGERQPAGMVHADEFVVRKRSRRKFERENPGALDHLNLHGRLPGFFLGGRVPAPRATQVSQHGGYPWARWSGDLNVPGSGDYGDPVVAWKAGRVAAVTMMNGSYGNHIRMDHGGQNTLYAHLSRFAASVGQSVRAGQKIGEVGSTGNSSGPHLHFEVAGGAAALGGDSISGWLGGVAKSPADVLKDMFGGLSPVGYLKDKFNLDALAKFGNSDLMKMITAMPKKLLGSAIDKVKSLATGFLSGPAPFQGEGSVKDTVRNMALNRGWGMGPQWAALDNLINAESSWNPKAANPNSTARGLFQKMTSIHGAIEPTVAGQTRWGFNYIANRYGDPSGAWGFHQQNGWYDQGGKLPTGLSTVMNGTGKTEAVLTSQQWQDIHALAGRGADLSNARFVLEVPGMGQLMTRVVRAEQDNARRFDREMARD